MLLGVALGSLLGALIWAELSFGGDIKEQVRRFAAAGGNVAVLSGPSGVDAARCDALRWDPHVLAAGGFRNGGQASAVNAPGDFFNRMEVTGGLVRVWDPNTRIDPRSQIWVGEAAAAELGVTDGGWLSLAGDRAVRVTTVDPAARNQFAARAILEPVPPRGTLAECWVELEPAVFSAALDWLPAALAADEATARPAISRGEFDVDPLAMLAGRPQRWAWLLVGLAASAIVGLVALSRRPDTAVYRAFGLMRSGLFVMLQVETITLVLGSYMVGALWAVTLYSVMEGLPSLDQLWLALRSAGMAAALICAVGPAASLAAGLGSPAQLLKER
jgi:hypothetical protein